LLAQNNWLRPQALVYVETEKGKNPNVPENWTVLKQKDSGQVSYRLYQVENTVVCLKKGGVTHKKCG